MDKELRAHAQDRKEAMVSVVIDWRFCEKKRHHLKRFTLAGPFSEELANEMYDFMAKLSQKNRESK